MKIISPLTVSPDYIGYETFNVLDPVQPFQVLSAGTFEVPTLTINVPEDDYPEWDSGESYDPEDRVMLNHRIYEAVSANSNVNPETDTSDPPKWLDLGPTNRWRMFDEKVGTATTNPDSIEISLTAGEIIDSVAFFNMDAQAIVVRVIDPYKGLIFNESIAPVSTDGIDTYWDYFFAPIVLREDLVVTNIPDSKFGTIEIDVLKPDGTAKAGAVILGKAQRLGYAEYGTSVSIVDYSRKERDPFGNSIIVERAFSKRAEFDVMLYTSEVSRVQRTLARYRARPLVWIGESSIEATIIYGYYKDFAIVISNPATSDCSISVEGLI